MGSSELELEEFQFRKLFIKNDNVILFIFGIAYIFSFLSVVGYSLYLLK